MDYCASGAKKAKPVVVTSALFCFFSVPLLGGPPDTPDWVGASVPSAALPSAVVHDPGAAVAGDATLTAKIRLTPVAAHPGGAYNTGGYYTSANISGQRLSVAPGGGRTYWNVQVLSWGPAHVLQSWQGGIEVAGLLGANADCGGGPGSCVSAGNLTLAAPSCTTSSQCESAFGEAAATCGGSICRSGFVNKGRSDWTHASISDGVGDYAFSPPSWPPLLYGHSPSGLQATDAGLVYYGGTLVVDVPADARGTYRIGFDLGNTFWVEQSPMAFWFDAMIPGELAVVCPCDADANNSGAVTSADESAVEACAEGNCSGCVNDCDIDCDGDVDYVDLGVTRCELLGQSDCCNAPMGACLGWYSAPGYEPCIETYQATCSIRAGTYQGHGTTCAGTACWCNADVDDNGTVNVIDVARVADCAQFGLCSSCVNGCDVNCDGRTDYVDMAAAHCEFVGGSNCCNLAIGACTIPGGSWPDCIETSQGACQFFSGTYFGNGSTCQEVCIANRSFESANYCPDRVNVVHVALSPLPDAFSAAVADSPPASWSVGAISNGGSYDAVNNKVKWGPLFPPFPSELTYEITPDAGASGSFCFDGVISVDGVNNTICGSDCLEYECCPFIVADSAQPACASCAVGNCSACSDGACDDGAVSLCEVIAYGCAWVRGCNDDIAGLTRSAFIWRNGECYCWDDAAQSFVPTSCSATNTCCAAGGAAGQADASLAPGSATGELAHFGLRGGSRVWDVTIHAVPAPGTAAAAVEVVVPPGWQVRSIGQDGGIDIEHGKIKWGPLFGDGPATLTATLVRDARNKDARMEVVEHGTAGVLRATASFDGVNVSFVVGP